MDQETTILSYLEEFRRDIEPDFSFLRQYGFSGPTCTVTPFGYYAVYRSSKVWLCVAVEHREGGLNIKVGRVDTATQRWPEERWFGEPYVFPAVRADMLQLLFTRDRDSADRIVVLMRDLTNREEQLEAQGLFAKALRDHFESVLRGEVLFG